MPMFDRLCPLCGQRKKDGRARMCQKCRYARWRESATVTGIAGGKVRKAIREGLLPRLTGEIPCTDCGAPAKQYDHRWYSRPLEVQPVCRRCNILRGCAFDSPLRDGIIKPLVGRAYG